MRLFILTICVFGFSLVSFSQVIFEEESKSERLKSDLVKLEYEKKETIFLKELYSKRDTTITSTKELHDSLFIKLVDSLDRNPPLGFYQKSAELLSNFKIDQAAFLLNLGQLRFKYYNLTNPNYSASGDGALLMSLTYVIAEPISKYLKTNIDNYIEILNNCIDWHSKHDYLFVKENKDITKYKNLTASLISIKDDYLNNKITYTKEWEEDISMFLKNSDSILNDIDKEIKSKKKKLKSIN